MPRGRALVAALLFFALYTVPAAAKTASFFVPPQQSNASLQVSELGFANITGVFGRSTASFKFDEDDKSISGLRLAIESGSLVTGNPEHAAALTGTDQLAAREYSEISFIQLKPATFTDGKAKIEGELAVRGTRKPFTFEATLNRTGSTPYGGGFWGGEGYAAGLSLRGAFKRADYGMTDPYKETASRFGDAITLSVEMQALRQN